TLMAADILLYQTNLVPVGKDQKQHLELTRDLAGRMNTKFGSDQKPLFKIPEPFIPPVGAKIMDLQDPTKKMSKSSQSDSGTVFLTDDEKKIMKKVKRAVTDSGSEIRFDENSQPGVSNLLTIQAVLTGESIESRVKAYEGKQYGHLKIETGEMIVENLRPLQEEMNRLLEDKAELDQILKKGALKAREKASQTLDHVYSSIGFFPRVSL
ncbi:MAG: tryptophan--tRNA ligase, partial [Bdellovibrionaceae bacterium]|nr:tryptophan--tRNA ligase [Pseudobdellovibrionaceae bacterium]